MIARDTPVRPPAETSRDWPTLVRRVLLGVVVLIAGNVGAMVDQVLHPEIPYFDEEHLLVGGLTALTLVVAFGVLDFYLSQRRRAETALRQSEAELREAQRVAGMGSWEWVVGSDTITRSDELRHLLRYDGTRPMPTVATLGSVYSPESGERLDAAVKRALQAGEPFALDLEMRRADGTALWVATCGEVVRDPTGQVLKLRGTTLDITERRQAEATLTKEKQNLDALFESSPVGLLLFDATTTVVRGNAAGIALTGGSEAEFLQQRMGNALRCVHSSDDPRGCGFSAACTLCPLRNGIEALIASGGSLHGAEIPLTLLRNGVPAKVCMRIGAEPVMINGARHLLVAMDDITERKQAELELRESKARLAVAMDQARLAHWEMDAETRTFTFNDRFYDLCGTTAEREGGYLMRADVYAREFLSPVDEHLAPDHVARLLSGGIEELQVEHRLQRRDGELRDILVRITVVRDASGRVTGTRGANQDITELRRAEAEKSALEIQLQHAQKMESVGRLAGGVAHEFNNMLGVILGFTELSLSRVGTAEPLHADLLEIQKAAQRSADLTRQLLAYARKQTVQPVMMDLNDAVANLLLMLQRLIGENIRITWEPGPSLWTIAMDPSQLASVLANLCLNARDAIAGVGVGVGVGAITLATANCTLEADFCADLPDAVPGDYVRLTVRDTGRGMDAMTLARIFEPFFTTKGVGEGTGLGLASVYGAARQNGGFITVASVVDHGTTFTLYFPRLAAEVAVTQGAEVMTVAAQGNETILLVEDELAILRLTTRVLTTLGYMVLPASSPGEGIRLAREYAGDIHLLLCDLVMPDMNGRDLASAVLAVRPTLRQLFMSGHTSDVIASSGLLEPGVSFIGKPYAIAAMTAKVREVLDGV